MKTYLINGSRYLNPYVAICTCCDKTFRTIGKAIEHTDKTGEEVYFCEEI